MVKSLQASLTKLHNRLQVNSARFKQLVVEGSKPRVRRWHEQEGLLSTTWQAWCWFCRSVILDSAKGASTVSGGTTTSAYAVNTEAELCYLAARFKQKQNPGTIKSIKGSHLEPTWGDLSAINLIVSGLNSSNSSVLLKAFGSSILVDDLQLIRNASAHLNRDNQKAIRSQQPKYNKSAFIHPSDAIYWEDSVSVDFAFNAWVNEMKAISTLAVN